MKETKINERKSKITGEIKRIDKGKIIKDDFVNTEAIMVSINWKGLKEHN